MKVLVVKLSSLGDVIHTLPALSDASRALPGIRFDWVVEEAFAEVPGWHRAVDTVIPVAVRRWTDCRIICDLNSDLRSVLLTIRVLRSCVVWRNCTTNRCFSGVSPELSPIH